MTDQTVDTRPPGRSGPPEPPGPPPGDEAPRAGGRLRIDPRFRQRRIQIKREEGRRRLRLLIGVTSALVACLLIFGAVKSPLLVVRHVRVFGAVNTPVAAVVQATGLGSRPHMIDVNAGRIARLAARLPWVDRVSVRRHWPATIEVDVTERVAVATIGTAGATMLVDRTGRVLGPPTAGVPASPVPIVTLEPVAAPPPASAGTSPTGSGTTQTAVVALPTTPTTLAPTPGPTAAITPPPLGPPGSTVDPAYAPALLVASALPPGLVARVVGVAASRDGTVTVHLAGGPTAVLGSPGDALAEKLQAVQTMLEHIKIPIGNTSPAASGAAPLIIDVTVPSAPVLVGGPATAGVG